MSHFSKVLATLCLATAATGGEMRIGHLDLTLTEPHDALALDTGLTAWNALPGSTIRPVEQGVVLDGAQAPAGLLSKATIGDRQLISFRLHPQQGARFECRFMLRSATLEEATTQDAFDEANHCYSLTLDWDNAAARLLLRKYPQGSIVDEAPLPQDNVGRPWRLAIAKNGNRIRVFVDDVPLHLWWDYEVSGDDAAYPEGQLLLAVRDGVTEVREMLVQGIEELRERPLETLKPEDLQLDLAQARIVVGSNPLHPQIAESLARLLHERTGVRPPIVKDTAWNEGQPAAAPLIALGNLADNGLVRKLYCEWFCMVDKAFPGTGGSLIQSIQDPWGKGQNILLLGAGDDAGLQQALARFGELLPDNGRLGWVYDCQPAPQFARFRDYDPKEEPYLILPLQYPNHFSLRNEAQQAAFCYLISGADHFAEIYREKLLAQVEEGPVRHLNMPAWPVQWRLLDAHPVFSPDERLRIANWFLAQLRHAEGMGSLHLQLLHNGMPHQNHGSRPALGSFFIARYFRDHYKSAEAMLYLRRLERYFAMQEEWSKPMCDSSMHQWNATLENKATYALASGQLGFFTSGAARQAAERALRTTNNVGMLPTNGDTRWEFGADALLAKAAFFYEDPRYLWPLQQRGTHRSFQDELGRSFAVLPGAVDPLDIVGVSVIPYDWGWWEKGRPSLPKYALIPAPNVPYERAFDKIAFRTGLDRNDEFLVLDGMLGASHDYDDVNTIHEYSRNGRTYITTADNLQASTMAHHNGVNIVRNGLASAVPSAAEWLHAGNAETVQISQTRVNEYSDSDWTRTVVLKPEGFFVVVDQVSARKPGNYMLTGTWRLLGNPRFAGDTLRVTQWPRTEKANKDNRTFFHLQAPGERTAYEQKPYKYSLNVRYYPYARTNIEQVTQSRVAELNAGESAWLLALGHETGSDPTARWVLHEVADGVARLSDGTEAAYVGAPRHAIRIGNLEIDADVFYLDASVLVLAGGRRAAFNGHSLLPGDDPAIRRVELAEVPGLAQQLASPDYDRAPAAPEKGAAPVPDLVQKWRFEATGEIRTLRHENLGPNHGIVAVPSRGGDVAFLDAGGEVVARITAAAPVNDVALVDLDGEGQPAVLLAREDSVLECRNADGSIRFVFAPEKEPIVNSSLWLGRNSMQRVWAARRSADGPYTICVSSGDQRLHGLDEKGERQWLFWTYAGVCNRFATIDWDGDGRQEFLAGNGEISSAASAFVLDGRDVYQERIPVSGWGSALSTLAVGDISGQGTDVLIGGTTRNILRVYAPGQIEPLWTHDMGEAVSDARVLPNVGGRPLLLASALSGFVVAFRSDGATAWATPVGAPVRHLAVMQAGNDTRVAALCQGGEVVLLGPDGAILYRHNLGREPVAAVVSPAAPGLLLVAGADHTVTALALPQD